MTPLTRQHIYIEAFHDNSIDTIKPLIRDILQLHFYTMKPLIWKQIYTVNQIQVHIYALSYLIRGRFFSIYIYLIHIIFTVYTVSPKQLPSLGPTALEPEHQNPRYQLHSIMSIRLASHYIFTSPYFYHIHLKT